MHPNGTGLQTLVHDTEGGIIAMDYHYRYDVYVCISYKCKLVRQEVYAGIHIMHLFAPYRILIFLSISYHGNWLYLGVSGISLCNRTPAYFASH